MCTINWALENLNDFTQTSQLFLGLALEERQFSWWVEELVGCHGNCSSGLRVTPRNSCRGVGVQGSGSCAHHSLHSKEHFHKELGFSHLFPVGKHSNLDCRDWFCQKHRGGPNGTGTKHLKKLPSSSLIHGQNVKISKMGIRGPFSWWVFKKAGTDAHSLSIRSEKDPEWK